MNIIEEIRNIAFVPYGEKLGLRINRSNGSACRLNELTKANIDVSFEELKILNCFRNLNDEGKCKAFTHMIALFEEYPDLEKLGAVVIVGNDRIFLKDTIETTETLKHKKAEFKEE